MAGSNIKLTYSVIGVLIVMAVFSGFVLEWHFGKDTIDLYRDGVVIAKEKWVVSAERTWSTINYKYQETSCLKKGGTIKRYNSSLPRCYYPKNYYEPLSRSLINTNIYSTNLSGGGFFVTKESPNFMYGTSGTYAGYVVEKMQFIDPTASELKFPESYTINWSPKDTRNYKLVWRVEGLKEINLPNGEYHDCKYQFGKILIDVTKDCDKLDKMVISSGTKAHFYFNSGRGVQNFNPTLVDPTPENDAIDGMVAYSQVGNKTPKYRLWNKTEGISDELNDTLTTGDSNITWVVTKGNPQREEFIVGTQDEDYDVNVQVYNANTDTWSNLLEVSTDVSNYSYRAFDIAYEQLSGNALIVYESTSEEDTNFSYRIWDGTSYSAEQNWSTPATAGTFNWIQLVERRDSNDIMVLAHNNETDGDGDLYVIIWNGTEFVWDSQNVTATDTISSKTQAFSFEWETDTGEGLVMWGEGTFFKYRFYFNGAWTTADAGSELANGLDTVRMCSSRGSAGEDNIGAIVQSLNGTTRILIWDADLDAMLNAVGGTVSDLSNSVPNGLRNINVDCAWYSKDDLLFGFINNTSSVNYVNVSERGGLYYWSTTNMNNANSSADFASGNISGMRFSEHPSLNEIMVVANDIDGNISTIKWEWGFQPMGTPHLSERVGDGTTERAMFAWDRYNVVKLLIQENNTIILSNFDQIQFQCNASSGETLDNISIYFDLPGGWHRNTTNDTSALNLKGVAFQKNFSLEMGTYNWNCEACDNTGYCELYSSNWTVKVTELNLSLDGIEENNTYEYQTTANVTANLQFIDIYDDTGRYYDQSSPFTYLIDLLRINVLNNTHTSVTASPTSPAIHSTDNRNYFYNVSFNITNNLYILQPYSPSNPFGADYVWNLDGNCSNSVPNGKNCTNHNNIGKFSDDTPFGTGKSLSYLFNDGGYLVANITGLIPTNNWTISFWYKLNGTDGGDVFGQFDPVYGTETSGIRMTTSGGLGNTNILSNDTSQVNEYDFDYGAFLDGNWHQFVWVHNSGTVSNLSQYYIDGVSLPYFGWNSDNPLDNNAILKQGFIITCSKQTDGSTSSCSTALVDDVLIWNHTALTSSQVSSVYNTQITSTDLTINYSGTSGKVLIPGKIQSNLVTQDQFIYNSVNYTSVNITFPLTTTQTVYINYSGQGQPETRNGLLNFTLASFQLDAANTFLYQENFSSIPQATTNATLAQNVTLFGPIDDFEDNLTTGWSNSGGTLTVEEGQDKYLYWIYSSRGCGSCSGYTQDSLVNFDLRKSRQFSTTLYSEGSGSCVDSGTPAMSMTRSIYLTDGTNVVTLWSIGAGIGCAQKNSFSSPVSVNLSGIISDDDNYISVYVAGTFYQTISIVSLDKSVQPHLKLSTSHSDSGYNHQITSTYKLYSLNVSGISLEMNRSNYTGVSRNYTTRSLFIAPTEIRRAIINATIYQPSGSSVSLYLSNNNGTTYELAANGGTHVFTTTGKNLSARFELGSTVKTSAPLIYKYQVEITPTQLSGLSIDIGADGTYDVEYNYTLNETNTPLNYTGNDTAFNRYIDSQNCTDCLVPIVFSSYSAGVLQLTNFNVTENINPIYLNSSLFNGKAQVNFTPSSSIIINDIKFDYYGRKNITVMAHEGTLSINRTLSVFYSPFNVTIIPAGIEYWDIGANLYSADQKEVVPFGNGNGNGNPFFNVTLNTWDHPTDIYIKYNESVNSCAVTWFQGINRVTNATFNVTLNTTGQLLVSNLSTVGLFNNISTWTNLSCSSSNGTLIIPLFCYTSLCSDCVKTVDWDDNCDLVE